MGAFPRVVYWDADTRKDLLVGLSNGTVMLFLNTATDQEPAFDGGSLLQVGATAAKVDLDVGFRATPAVVDWNNDLRKDLVIGAFDGSVHLFLNEGTDSEPDFITESLVQDSGVPLYLSTLRTSPTVGDVTSDGSKDLILGESNGYLSLYENMGSDDSPLFAGSVAVTSEGTPIVMPSLRSRPSLCDWGGNGVLDLLVGSADGMVRLYRGSGALFADGFESGDTTAWSVTVQ